MSSSPLERSWPVALCLEGRNVLVIGGDAEATDKADKLLAAGARVTVVAECVTPGLAERARSGELRWFARGYTESDLRGSQLVLLTELDAHLAGALRAQKSRHGYLLGALDQPAFSDFYLMSTFVRGPVNIAISTTGRAPSLARVLRKAFEKGLGDEFTRFAESIASLRAELRSLSKTERISHMARALQGFALDVRVSYPDRREASGDPSSGPDA